MNVKFKIKALTYYGKTKSFILDVECPDFEVIPSSVFDGFKLPEISINSQIIDWFDEQDKTNIMQSKDLYLIFDYSIYEAKQKKTLKDLLINLNFSEKLMLDILALSIEIKDILKNKTAEKKLELILSHLKVGYMASTNSYSRIIKILKAENSSEAKKLIENERKN